MGDNKEGTLSALAEETEQEFLVGDEFEIIDPREEGNLFRVIDFYEMKEGTIAVLRKLGVEVDDGTRGVYCWELERQHDRMVGTRRRAFPASLMVQPGQRRSNRSTGKAAVQRVPKNARPCECGCGEMTKGGRFRPGHDARMHAKSKKS